MRKRIAAHMSASMATAPHVTTVFEADMSRVVAHRQQHLREFESRGVKLTYTAYFVAGCVKALQAVPDWRWLLEREDCPWYPTMRLFRQRTRGDWAEVFARVAEELARHVAATRR